MAWTSLNLAGFILEIDLTSSRFSWSSSQYLTTRRRHSSFSSIRSTIHRHNSLSCRGSCYSSDQSSLGWRKIYYPPPQLLELSWFLLLLRPVVTWPKKTRLIEARRCLWIPSVSTKPDHLVCQTGQSGFHSLGQELPVPVCFVWQHQLHAGLKLIFIQSACSTQK
jgi:hypothetical protein